MTLIYEDYRFTVTQKMLGGWRVRDRSTGRTLVPNLDQVERIGFVWKAIRAGRFTRMCPPDGSAEAILFEVFANAVAEPWGPPGVLFLKGTPDDTAAAIVHEANRRHAEDRLFNTGRRPPLR